MWGKMWCTLQISGIRCNSHIPELFSNSLFKCSAIPFNRFFYGSLFLSYYAIYAIYVTLCLKNLVSLILVGFIFLRRHPFIFSIFRISIKICKLWRVSKYVNDFYVTTSLTSLFSYVEVPVRSYCSSFSKLSKWNGCSFILS